MLAGAGTDACTENDGNNSGQARALGVQASMLASAGADACTQNDVNHWSKLEHLGGRLRCLQVQAPMPAPKTMESIGANLSTLGCKHRRLQVDKNIRWHSSGLHEIPSEMKPQATSNNTQLTGQSVV